MPDTEQPAKPELHLRYLDSVRGIAALMVVFYHFLNWNYKDRLYMQVASIVFNGADAVSFFFVLSGFVLSYKYIVLKHKLDVRKFYINRFFRLWPAFFITVITNALYHQRHHMGWQRFLELFVYNKYGFWEEASLIRSSNHVYYLPGWTLTIELVMSFFIPFVVLMAHKDKRSVWWLAGFFFLVGTGMFCSGMFIGHFIFGALVATYYYAITAKSFEDSWFFRKRYLVLTAGIIFFSARHLEYIFGTNWFYDEVIYKFLGYEVTYITGLGSFIILVFIVHSRKAQRWLEHSVLRFFGRISYGIYLMHWLLVTMIFDHRAMLSAYFPNEKIAFVCLLFICVGLTILLAYIVYRFVELPFIRLGKKITSKMKPMFVIEP